MAGEIVQNVALVLSSAAIGAGGSVLSQAVGGFITSRREKKKAEADERRWKLEIEAKRRDRQLEHKTELFGKFLSAAEEVRRSREWGQAPSHKGYMAQRDVLDNLRDWAEEIGLIAPEVYRHVTYTYSGVQGLFSEKYMAQANPKSAKSLEAIKMGEENLAFWIGVTRRAIRSYINHEPVDLPEEKIAEHRANLRRLARNPEPGVTAAQE